LYTVHIILLVLGPLFWELSQYGDGNSDKKFVRLAGATWPPTTQQASGLKLWACGLNWVELGFDQFGVFLVIHKKPTLGETIRKARDAYLPE